MNSSGLVVKSVNSWTKIGMYAILGLMFLLFSEILLAAAVPSTMMFATVLLFCICLFSLFLIVPKFFALFCKEFKTIKEGVGGKGHGHALFGFSSLILIALLVMFFSHDIVQSLSSGLRYLAVHAWGFVVYYFHHAFCG